MNGHISNMKENSSAGAAEDSSRLHKASQRHMTESDAAGDKYGLAVESRHKGRSVVCSGRQQKILPLGRQCVSCVETLFISPSGPRSATQPWHCGLMQEQQEGEARVAREDPLRRRK